MAFLYYNRRKRLFLASTNNMTKLLTSLKFLIAFFLLTNLNAQKAYDSRKYSGTIGKNPIVLEMVSGDFWMGDYYYTKHNKKIQFTSDKMIYEEGKQIKLKEFVNGKNTGYFLFTVIDFNKKKLNGKWFTPDGKKSYVVLLTKID